MNSQQYLLIKIPKGGNSLGSIQTCQIVDTCGDIEVENWTPLHLQENQQNNEYIKMAFIARGVNKGDVRFQVIIPKHIIFLSQLKEAFVHESVAFFDPDREYNILQYYIKFRESQYLDCKICFQHGDIANIGDISSKLIIKMCYTYATNNSMSNWLALTSSTLSAI